jgi:hypothetical protein
VEQVVPVHHIERLAGIQPDQHQLRRRQQTPRSSRSRKLPPPRYSLATYNTSRSFQLAAPEVQHGGHVGVVQRRCHPHGGPEDVADLRNVAEVGVHQLEHDGALQLLVERLEDGRFQATAQPGAEAVAPRDDS